MKASKYNIFVKDNHAIYAVNLLSRSAMELSLDAYNTFLSLTQNDTTMPNDPKLDLFVKTLEDGMFLLDEDFDELAYIRYRCNQERFDNKELGIVITPTMKCNFHCYYCFEQKSNVCLNQEAQDRILKLVAYNIVGRNNLNVQWFGGEPLEAINIIKDLSRIFIRLADTAGVSYEAIVVTNGYLMTKDVSHLLKDLGVKSVQITLDGDRYLHDRTRFNNANGGSFDVILNNIRRASEYLSIKVRVHVTPLNVGSICRLIAELGKKEMVNHITELYFAPLFNYRSSMMGQPYKPDGKRYMTSEEFANVQIDLFKRATAWGFTMPDFLDVPYGICTAVKGNTLVIDANGNLVKCYKDVGVVSEAIGTVETGPKSIRNLLKWMDLQIPREACRDCLVLPICLGGCHKQWISGASKDVICNPLVFNIDERIHLYFESERALGIEKSKS